MSITPATQNGSKVTYELKYIENGTIPGWTITSVNGEQSLFDEYDDNVGFEYVPSSPYGYKVDPGQAVWSMVHDLTQHHHNPIEIHADEVTGIYLGCRSFSHISGEFAKDACDTIAHGIATDEICYSNVDIDSLDEYAIEYIDNCWDALRTQIAELLDDTYEWYGVTVSDWDKVKHWIYDCADKAEKLIDKYGESGFDNVRYNLSAMLPDFFRCADQYDTLTIVIDFDDYNNIQLSSTSELEEENQDRVDNFLTDLPNQLCTFGLCDRIAQYLYDEDAIHDLEDLLEDPEDENVEAWVKALEQGNVNEIVEWLQGRDTYEILEIAEDFDY